MKTKDIITYVMIGGGVYALYWYITTYGPLGKVTDANGHSIPGAVSYWASWFGGAVAAPANTPTTTGTTTTTTTTTTGTGTPAPTPPTFSIPAGLTVVADINNSLKGTILVNGAPMTINVIPSSGAVYNTAGQNITSSFTSAQIQQLVSAFQAAAPAQQPSGGTSGTVVSNDPGLATPSQIQQITALLKSSDVPAFQAMVAQGLTQAQAAAMLTNAQTCASSGSTYSSNGICTPAVALSLRNQLLQAAGDPTANIMLSKYQWNYYYNQIKGTPNAVWNLAGDDSPISIDTYLDLRQSAGVGVSGMSGMGMGAITEVRSVTRSTAPPVQSPWGRIAAVDAGGMGWKN